jgi:Ni/Co efflux regulator RcnB
MNKLSKLFTVSALSLALISSASFAQDHHDDHRQADQHDHYVHHNDWRRGRRMSHDDWARGQHIDYRQHHLRAPRRGYEWRQVDGNYVLAAVATGLIASIVVASASH